MTMKREASLANQTLGFFSGVRALLRGVRLFWTHPRWWGWALLPTVAILFLAGVTWKGVALLFQDVFGAPPVVTLVSAYIITLGSFYLLFPVLYEALGGLFFDGLTTRVYRDVFQKTVTSPTVRASLRYSLHALKYSGCTMLLAMVLFFIWLIPWVGGLLGCALFGYRFGVSYLFSSGLLRGETVQETLTWARTHRKAVAGFGISAYVVLLFFPFIGLFFVPSFVVAAVLLREGEPQAGTRAITKRCDACDKTP